MVFCRYFIILILFSFLAIIIDGTHLHSKSNQERINDAFESHIQNHASNQIDDHALDHEAILGSRKKTQEFDALSSEESKRRLKKLAQNGMDTNRDGFVDPNELQAWVLKSFTNLAIEEGEESLAEEDIDNDGFVSWNEHLKGAFDFDDDTKVIHFIFFSVINIFFVLDKRLFI